MWSAGNSIEMSVWTMPNNLHRNSRHCAVRHRMIIVIQWSSSKIWIIMPVSLTEVVVSSSFQHWLIALVLTASYQDGLGKLVPKCQTILDFATQQMMEVSLVTTRTLRHASCRHIVVTNIPSLSFLQVTGPFCRQAHTVEALKTWSKIRRSPWFSRSGIQIRWLKSELL